jgi:hypothetical protein
LLQLHRFAGHGDRQAFEIAHRRVGRIGRKSGVEQPHDRRTLVVQGYRDAMQNEITMKANGPTEVTNRPSAAAPANERKEDTQFRVEDWRYMEASFNLYLFERAEPRSECSCSISFGDVAAPFCAAVMENSELDVVG